MELKNRWSSLVLFALGVGVCLLSLRLPFGTLRQPREGFMPFFLGLLLAGLSLADFLFAQGKKNNHSEAKNNYRRVWLAGGAMAFYALLFSFVGYLLATFGVILWILRLVYRVRWGTALLFSTGAAGLSFILFVYALNVPLPPGILKGLIR